MISQADIWEADFGEPRGSAPGYRRPVVVVQGDRLNRSHLATIVVVPLTSNLKWANVAGNVLLNPRRGLVLPSVANVSQVTAIDRASLMKHLARASSDELDAIMAGIDFVLGQET